MGKSKKKTNSSNDLKNNVTNVNSKNSHLPFVSVCTPTYNRRPFWEGTIKCFDNQIYPKDRMEWIIIDDGTDKIEDLVKDHPNVKYYKYDEKMNLGTKRNLMHDKSKGDILVYMDDDDYYPKERVSHAVEMLQKNPDKLVAGSSEIYIYFKHIDQMYKFGPYGPNHSTAGTFALKREILSLTRYDESKALAEEKSFLKDYSFPVVQLDPLKVILVFSHNHNTFDKRTLLFSGGNNPLQLESDRIVEEFVQEEDLMDFYLNLDDRLSNYNDGLPDMKPDVVKQQKEMEIERNAMIENNVNKHRAYWIMNSPDFIKELSKYSDKEKELIIKNINEIKTQHPNAPVPGNGQTQPNQTNMQEKIILEQIKKDSQLQGEQLELELLKTSRNIAGQFEEFKKKAQNTVNQMQNTIIQLQNNNNSNSNKEMNELQEIQQQQYNSLLDIIKSLREENESLKKENLQFKKTQKTQETQ